MSLHCSPASFLASSSQRALHCGFFVRPGSARETIQHCGMYLYFDPARYSLLWCCCVSCFGLCPACLRRSERFPVCVSYSGNNSHCENGLSYGMSPHCCFGQNYDSCGSRLSRKRMCRYCWKCWYYARKKNRAYLSGMSHKSRWRFGWSCFPALRFGWSHHFGPHFASGFVPGFYSAAGIPLW
jgi:hypothetical protein